MDATRLAAETKIYLDPVTGFGPPGATWSRFPGRCNTHLIGNPLLPTCKGFAKERKVGPGVGLRWP